MQGGMMWISRAELTSAVSNAGGLGTMTALTFSQPKDLSAEIKKTRQTDEEHVRRQRDPPARIQAD